MKKIIMAAALILMTAGSTNAEEIVKIGRQNITIKDGRMTPEALWAMGRIGSYEASPDGSKVVYQVGYYNVKANKSKQVLYVMNADGSDNHQLTPNTQKSETDPTWIDAETIAFVTEGEIWTMKSDGSNRRQLSKTDGKVEGFKFSPDRKQVIILKSIPY